MAWLYKQNGSENWWIGYRSNGKQYLRSTGTSDKTKAERELAKVETMFSAHAAGSLTEQLYRELTGRSVPQVPLKSAMAEWVTEARRSAAPATAAKYARLSLEFCEHVQANDLRPLLSDINREHVITYLTAKHAAASTSTVNLLRKVLSVFFIREIKQGLIKENPVFSVPPFKAGKGEVLARRGFTVEEIRLLYSKAPTPFWKYMVMMGFFSGQRMGDLICLQWGAVDWQQNIIRLTTRKTGKTVDVPMRPEVRALLTAIKRGSKKPNDNIWPDEAERYETKGAGSFSNEFYDEVLTPCGLVAPRKDKQSHKSGRDAKREVGNLSFHCLRHSFVSLLKATGGHQSTVKALVGHSSDSMNDHYTHMPAETLKAAIAALPEVT